jgi:hypothetical protein
MRAHSMLCLSVLALAGCALTDKIHALGGGGSKQADFRAEYAGGNLCSTDPCDVKVTVGRNCAISVDPPTLGVDQNLETTTIRWTIQPGAPGTVKFAANGINPKYPNKWKKDFKNPTAGDQVFTWLDNNKQAGEPKKRQQDYNIDLTQDGVPCHKDPIIINDY